MARRTQRISGARLQRVIEAATARAVNEMADEIGAESQKIVLFLDGHLAESGETVPADPGPRPVARYRYTIVYARRRHEETHRQDGTPIQVSLPGRMPKFLEIPFKAKEPEIQLHVARSINRVVRLAAAGTTAGGHQGI